MTVLDKPHRKVWVARHLNGEVYPARRLRPRHHDGPRFNKNGGHTMQMRGLEKLVLASRPWAVFSRSVLVPWLVARADLPQRADALELGCGAGGETEALARRFPQWRITATDYDPDMVARAAARLTYLRDRIKVEQADATALPHPDAAFDIVVAMHVWHHVGDWRAATAEVHRVLRAGGALLLFDVSVPPIVARRIPRLAPPGAYTVTELRDVLDATGFTSQLRTSPGGVWYRALARRRR